MQWASFNKASVSVNLQKGASWTTVNVKVVRVVAPHGRVLEFTSDASNRVTSVRDTIGRTVNYTYDATGRLWKVTDVAGGVTEYSYDSAHRMLTIKDPRGIFLVLISQVWRFQGWAYQYRAYQGLAYPCLHHQWGGARVGRATEGVQ